MTVDDTREALAAMVREGEAAGMYADDHGAAGFCTDHGQPANRPTTVAEAVEVGVRALERHTLGRRVDGSLRCPVDDWTGVEDDAPGHLVAAVLEAVGYADLLAEVAEWHAECDKVGVPYDPPGLVRHHRANAGMASENWKVLATNRKAQRDALAATVARVKALAEKWQAVHDGIAPMLGHPPQGQVQRFAEELLAALGLTVTDTPTEAGSGDCFEVCQGRDPGDCVAAQQAEAQRLCDEDRRYDEDEEGAR